MTTPQISKGNLLAAAKKMDWQQVVLNGGPPCFHLEQRGAFWRFCGRAERWGGHRGEHKYISLESLLKQMRRAK